MADTADAVVVGAGLNGAATAFFLIRRGLRRIVILDSDRGAAGASGAAVGLLRSHYDNRPETELAARSMPYFRHWPELVGGDCGWRATGFFRFVEPEELEPMRRNVAVQRAFGERVEILAPEALRGLAPEFSLDGVGAVVHEPESGTASNARATHAMLAAACAAGALFEPYTAALRVDVAGGRVAGIATSRGRVATPIVVLAAGVGCAALAASCGIEMPLEQRPIRVAEIRPPDALRLPGSYMDPVSDSWIAPREQGRALIAAGRPAAPVPDTGDGADFTRADAERGLSPVARRLPGITGAIVTRWWTRGDCYAPDGKPIIGAAPGIAGLYLNTAGAGKGHKVAPAAGLALSELITAGRSTTCDLTPFGLGRFTQPPRPWSDSEYRKRVIG